MFLSRRNWLTLQQSILKERMEECKKQYEANRQAAGTAAEKQKSVVSMADLTEQQLREHLYDAIERVLVYGPDDIEIIWKFQNTTATA